MPWGVTNHFAQSGARGSRGLRDGLDAGRGQQGRRLTPAPLASAPSACTSPVCPLPGLCLTWSPETQPEWTCADRLLPSLGPGACRRPEGRVQTHTHAHTRAFSRTHAPARTPPCLCALTHTALLALPLPLQGLLLHDMQAQTDSSHRAGWGLTLRSLWTTPIWWQWRTASRICWMQ